MLNKTPMQLLPVLFLVVFSACSPQAADELVVEPSTLTALAATLTALPSNTPIPSPAVTSIVIPTATGAQLSTAAPPFAVVVSATLCWAGPGPAYEVVSSLEKTERVMLLGRASPPDWWIVEDPIQHDPCWVSARELRLEPATNTAALLVFTPPPTPTPSFTPAPQSP
jgi:hypothetical protein